MTKDNKGITLIALVITIIVMLILAGVSINYVISDEGIIGRAKLAKMSMENAIRNDYIDMYKLNSEININTIDESKKMKLLINSGSDGQVAIPVNNLSDEMCYIDWGDGTNNLMSVNKNNEKRIASIDGLQVGLAWEIPEYCKHTYNELNKEYIVTIYADEFYGFSCTESQASKIIKVLQWGEDWRKLDFSGMINLEEIAAPTENSFRLLNTISFEGCTKLKAIPDNFFNNCPALRSLWRTFYNCISLTGNVDELWNKFGGIDGRGCFYNCTGLTNYNDIPSQWKANIPWS